MVTDRVHTKLLAHLIVLSIMLLAIPLRLFPCLFAGFLVHEAIVALSARLEWMMGGRQARRLAGFLVIAVPIVSLALGAASIPAPSELIRRGAEIDAEVGRLLRSIRCRVPRSLGSLVPESTGELLSSLSDPTKPSVVLIRTLGGDLLHFLVSVATGTIIGILIALDGERLGGPDLVEQLAGRLRHLSRAFRNTVFAQLKVSAINTLLTSALLLLILPLFDVSVPLGKTLILVTFISGLLPVVGNLVSSLTISAAALSVSFLAGLIVILYLVLIHKLEYFLSAEIVGCQINARPWELLAVMLIFDAVFGLQGTIAAPIYYAYLKSELRSHGFL